jgi:2-phosphosulfolactate phosphatase
MKRLRVLMTREEIVPDRLAGVTAVVVDVFLATTTLLTILENGARRVFPVASLEEADSVREELDAPNVLRGGEQDAHRIEGYDHGPFPEEYPPEVVAGKDVIFVTTNGTRPSPTRHLPRESSSAVSGTPRRSPVIWKGRGRIRWA